MISLSIYLALNRDNCDSSGDKQDGKLNPEVILKRAGRKDAVCVWLCPGGEGIPVAPLVQEQILHMLLSNRQPAVERVYFHIRTA